MTPPTPARGEREGRKSQPTSRKSPWAGWSLGTILGAVAGSLLPMFFRTALGIAIYGMFLAIVLPPSRKSKAVRTVVLISAGLSLLFRYVPGLNQLSPGYVIILCAFAAAGVGAWLFPVEEDEEENREEVQAT